MTINERIKHLRKVVLHLSQRKFALDLGMAQTGVSSMEQDGATITDRVIKSICLSYGVNEVWLRTGEGEILEQPETFSLDQYLKEHGCTTLEMEIVKAYFELDKETRQKVFELFDHFRARIDATKDRLAADADQQREIKAPQEMTAEELHAELDRQIAEEKRRAANEPAFGPESSKTATG